MTAPILTLAPDGRDAEVIRLVLGEIGLPVRSCADLPELCAGLREEVTAVVVTERALAGSPDGAGMEDLARCLDAQPSWSDLPVLILTANGPRPVGPSRRPLFDRLGNVTLLDRPLHAETLQSAARAAERARRRQYRTRAHLAEIAEANRLLEARVEERTRALKDETAERHKAEAALRQAQKMEAVGQLTGGIAHDFNNLLQVIQGNLYRLKGALGDRADLLDSVAMALTAGDRAAALTRHLLAFARRQPLAPRALDLNALVTAMSGLLRRSVGESVRVDLALADGLWPTWADVNQVESALLNLVLNARDAMPGGGRLIVATANAVIGDADAPAIPGAVPGDYVRLRVSDTGTGMAPDVLERVFEPFFTTKPIGQGTGLGLSQLYGFARQSGGFATVTSEAGRGTTVSLYLPRHAADIVAPAPAEIPAFERSAGLGRGEIVLVVEDEALVLMLWAETLADHGYRVLQATDSDSAIAILNSDATIDLMITDVGLPGLNGRDLATRARSMRPGLKVLFITGYAHYAALGRDALGPGSAMLSKPVEVERLHATVRGLLDEP